MPRNSILNIGKASLLTGAAVFMVSLPAANAKIILDETSPQISALAAPIGSRQGSEIDMPVPADAHLSEIVIYYSEGPDRINGIQLYYQPDLDSDPVSTNFVGELKGKSFRIPVGWNDVVTGLETMTDTSGNLVAFKLKTTGGDKGYGSTEAFETRTREFDDGLLFAGLRAQASKGRVHGLGILTKPASSAPARASYNAKLSGQKSSAFSNAVKRNQQSVNGRSNASSPARGGFAGALDRFQSEVRRGQADKAQQEFDERQRAQDAANERARAQARALQLQRERDLAKQRANNNWSQSASPRLGGNNVAILYEHCNYQGKAVALSTGAWDTASLGRLGMANDKVSSIRILNGYEIAASSEDYARGGVNKVFRTNQSCLVNQNFNDVISYARVRTRTGFQTATNTNLNNTTTSARPATTTRPSNTRPTTTTAALTNRSGATMDASRLRLGGNSHAIIYSRCGYRGKAIGLHGGSWSMARLKQLGFNGQSIAAIKLMPGKQITLKTQATSNTVTRNRACLNFPVHARPDFKEFQVGARSAVAAGQTKPAGFKARKADKLQWTPAGVTGNNVGSVWYEAVSRGAGNEIQRGRFEISEEGSSIWHWYIHSNTKDTQGNVIGRGSFDKPFATYRLLRRNATSVTLREVKRKNGRYVDVRSGNKSPWRDDVIDLSKGRIDSYGLFRDSTGGLLRGRISTKSRPK